MDLRQLKSFIAVAEELHCRRAAERLGMAQTALSSQVRSLEEELGFPLLFRTTWHVSLTQAGAMFLDEARAVLGRLETGVERASIAYLKGRYRAPSGPSWDEALAYWKTLATDEGAVFAREVNLNASSIAPLVTWGTSPD